MLNDWPVVQNREGVRGNGRSMKTTAWKAQTVSAADTSLFLILGFTSALCILTSHFSVHRCDQMCHIFVTPPPSGYRCSLQVDGLTASGPPLMNRFPFTYSPEFLAFFVSAVSFTHFSNYLTPPLLLLLLFIPFPPPPLSTSLRVSLLSSPFLSSSISFITSFSLLVSFGSPICTLAVDSKSIWIMCRGGQQSVNQIPLYGKVAVLKAAWPNIVNLS